MEGLGKAGNSLRFPAIGDSYSDFEGRRLGRSSYEGKMSNESETRKLRHYSLEARQD